MDLYTRIAFTAVLAVLEDKKKLPGARRAFLKLFKLIWTAFSDDQEFRDVVVEVEVPFKVK